MNINILLMIVFISIAYLTLGVWTFLDAKSRKLNAALWVVIVMLVPNFIGLILYFLIGRKQSLTQCIKCNQSVQSKSHFCPNCGSIMPEIANDIQFDKRKNKKLLIMFISCLIVIFLAIVGVFINIIKESPGAFTTFSSSVGMVEANFGNKWDLSFYSFNGVKKHNINLKNNSTKTLHIESELNSGSLFLNISQGDKTINVDLSKNEQDTTYNISDFQTGKITLCLNANNAKSGKVHIWWE